jgi:peptidoglycan-N-acetylglucosamine deacetylase
MTWYHILYNFFIYGLLTYSILLLLFYVFVAYYAAGETRRHLRKASFTDYKIIASSSYVPGISILAPAYNEGATIIESVRSLLNIHYNNLELIVINDGSKDDTLQKLIDGFDLKEITWLVEPHISTRAVRAVYKSNNSVYHKLLVVDKVNGGKADALNMGVNIASNQYLVCIDVDCILEQDALLKLIKPFLEEDKRVIAAGGVVRIANSCIIENGKLVKVNLPKQVLPRIQTLEYMRAFLLGRMAWSRLDGLLIISGAFGAFDREIVIKVGGYNSKTVGEDMELIVRMRRYMEESKLPYKVAYIPDPLCWTEAPASFKILGRQRNRWTRGTIETLKIHRKMFFNSTYGVLGMLSYPYWFFFEFMAPLIEFIGFVLFIIFALFGLIDWKFFLVLTGCIFSMGFLYSVFAILMEVLTYNQYKKPADVIKLVMAALLEPFLFHPFVVWAAVRGNIDLLRKKNAWGEMTRQGFSSQPATTMTSAKGNSIAKEMIPVFSNGAISAESKYILAKTKAQKLAIFIATIKLRFFEGAREFVKYAILLLLFFVLGRVFELVYDNALHGLPQHVERVIRFGLFNDVSFVLQACFCLYAPFALLYLVNKKSAKYCMVVLCTLLVLIQFSLSKYFLTTLVPLGADLWAYSVADIRQTVSAAGIQIWILILMMALLLCIITSFIYLPSKIKISKRLAMASLFIFIFATATKLSFLTNKLLPGEEYSNTLSINKSYFFFAASMHYFFPGKIDTGEYSGNTLAYTTDRPAAFKYVDEKNYPFLHFVDSSADVLSPFFNKSSAPPNIVILVVEGLGRAFTNKGAYLGNFTPFIDSLSNHSLYWENFLSEGGRTFAVFPSLLGSLPFAKNGFNELGENMPQHFSLLSLLKRNGYNTSFSYGGDSHFDNMDVFMKKNNIDTIKDEHTFPSGYEKMPGQSTWGYGDKELFRRYLETGAPGKPYINVLLTVSTHSPFFINQQETYMQRFEQRMVELGFTENQKKEHRNYKYQYASILFTDDAIKSFINNYKQRADFNNTVFLITGDHRMPEIPMATKLDRYHVPLVIYSPLLNRTAKFSSISTHFDITPSLLAWLKHNYSLKVPDVASWMGSGLDTTRDFRNTHAYPLMQTKNEVSDFIMGGYMLDGSDLFHIYSNMDIEPEQNDQKANELKMAFNRFRQKNEQFIKGAKLIPDSLYKKYQ